MTKYHDEVFRDMDKVFKQMDEIFKEVDKKMEEQFVQAENVINRTAKWEPHISWVPRKIGKRWYWRSPIYRKFVLSPGGGYYKYGTEFDVLKESK